LGGFLFTNLKLVVMREIFKQLEVLRKEDKEVFQVEVELLNPIPNELELMKFENEFPEVTEYIREIHRIGFCLI